MVYDLRSVIEHINLLEISTVTLTKRIRDCTGWSLSVALPLARIIKEAYRLGEIRGKALR